MYYHASQIADIEVLEPRTSNHNTPLIYFSTKRENVLVYLSNAIEKYCKETGFTHDGKWHKWASYGFESDGILRIDEYYPNAIEDTYKGVSGYIYYTDTIYYTIKFNTSLLFFYILATIIMSTIIKIETREKIQERRRSVRT